MSENKISIFIDEPYISEIRVTVIGVGGGALNVLDRFQPKMIDRLEVIVIDSDQNSLGNSKIAKTVCLNNAVDKNGEDFETVRRDFLKQEKEIRDLIEGADLAIVVVCLGGETGTSVAPSVVNLCKEKAALTVAFATTPFVFESVERHVRAEQGLKELQGAADTVIHIPMSDSQRLFGETLQTSEVFAYFDEFVAQSVRGLNDWFKYPGFINCDFSDVRAMFRNGGRGSAAVGSGEGVGRVEKVLKAALGEDNLLAGGVPLPAARNVLMLIEGSDSLCLFEVEQIVDYVQDVCDDDADIVFTAGCDEQLGERICLTLLTSGNRFLENRSKL